MTTSIRTIDLKVGDKISFYGALFEISSVRHISQPYRDDMGPEKTTIANGEEVKQSLGEVNPG